MPRLRTLVWTVLGLAVAGLIAVAWPDRKMISRDIGCSSVTPARGRDICSDLSASMRWTWFGHAIVSPGWRPTAQAVRDVYCRQRLTPADLPLLDEIGHTAADWRLESAAGDLARIVRNAGGRGDGPEPPAKPCYPQ